MSDIWQRATDETDKAFAAFCVYRDLGSERSIDKAYQRQNGGKTAPRWWEGWSTRYKWVERVKAYDNHLEAQRRSTMELAQLQAQVTIIQNELSDYLTMREGIQKRIDAMRAVNWQATPSDLRDLLDAIRRNDDMGRRAADLPDKITKNEQHHSGEISWRDAVEQAQADESS